MNFLSCVFPCIGECIGNAEVFASRGSIGNRLNFIFFFFPLSFLSFLFFPCFLPFFFLSFFFQLSAIKSFPSFSIRFRSRNRSFPLLLLQKKKEKREKRDRTLFPLPLVFIELFNRVFRERAILFFARCFSRSRETSRK